MNSDSVAHAERSGAGRHRLMESGRLAPPDDGGARREVRRAMTVIDRDGQAVGQVAAVWVNDAGTVTHVVHMCYCPEPEYRVLPVEAVADVGWADIRLAISGEALHGLPLRTGSRPGDSKQVKENGQ